MSHSHRTIEEHIGIEVFVHMGMSCLESAGRPGRHHAGISREPRRNSSKCARKRRTRPRPQGRARLPQDHGRHAWQGRGTVE